MRWEPAVLGLTVVLILGACGTGGPTAEERKAAAAQREQAAQERRQAEAERRAMDQYRACEEQIQPLVDALDELDSRLGVGLNFENYTQQVGDAGVAYDQVQISKLGPDCVGAAIAAEAALNSHIKANNSWNDCLQDFGCDDDANEAELQEYWLKATGKLEKAQGLLRDLRP